MTRTSMTYGIFIESLQCGVTSQLRSMAADASRLQEAAGVSDALSASDMACFLDD